MSLFNKLAKPIVLKDSSRLKEEYDYVKALSGKNSSSKLKLKLKQLEYELRSEENILNELKNSHIPMYILHDINLEYGEFKAQIDYVVITRSNIYVIETKEMFGKITIDCQGNFIRRYKFREKEYEEEFASPILQNEKHLELLKLIGYEHKNMIDKLVFDKLFYLYYKSLLVFGNERTVVDDHYASYDIKNQIVKVDRLIDYFKEDSNSSRNKFNDKEMRAIAESILKHHVNPFIYYDLLYKKYLPKESIVSDNDLKLEKELKKYRYYLANKEQVPVHMIFSDKILKSLISLKPLTNEALLEIKGLGIKKVAKYGKRIIGIIKKYVEN